MTDADLVAAQRRFAATVPGLVLPAAYAVARADPGGLHFGHVNPPGAVRPLPAVVLASVCGYVATTGVLADPDDSAIGPEDEAFRVLLSAPR